MNVIKKCLVAGVLFVAGLNLQAQEYAIDWFGMSSGGGTSTGGVYSASTTLGQPNAGQANGAGYTLTAGFWSFLGVVQASDAPELEIHPSGANVIVSWPMDATDYLLQVSPTVGPAAAWNTIPSPYLNDGDRYFAILPTVPGCQFFQLVMP